MFPFIFFLLIIFASNVTAQEIDFINPIEVAKYSNELGLKFKYEELTEISCEEVSSSIQGAKNQANQAVQLFENAGIDFYKEVEYNF